MNIIPEDSDLEGVKYVIEFAYFLPQLLRSCRSLKKEEQNIYTELHEYLWNTQFYINHLENI